MATSTTNYSLRKPDPSDHVNVETDIGDNMDTIDTTVKAVSDAVALKATTAALTAHDIDTTAVHGIADTSALATSSGVTSAVSTHAGLADPHTGYVLESLLDAKGDLYAGTADNAVGRLAVGANDFLLTADSAQTTGLKWAAAPSGGITGQGAGTNSVLVGDSATASADQSTALGDFAVSSIDGGIAIGSGTNATSAAQATTGQGAIAIGASNAAGVAGARATAANSVAIGSGHATNAGAAASQADCIAIGRLAAASILNSIAIGSNSIASTGTSAIAIGGGYNASNAPNATGVASIAIGVSDAGSGTGARASGARSVAIGGAAANFNAATASALQAIAIGGSTTSTASASTAIGASANATGTDSVAIGTAAQGIHASSVALGISATTTAVNQIRLGTATEDINIPGTLTLSGGSVTPGAWVSWTPTIDQGASTNIAKTVSYAKYARIGKTIMTNVKLALTGSGSGAADITLSLPFTAAYGTNIEVGVGTVFDSDAVAAYKGTALLVSTTQLRFRPTNTATTGTLGSDTMTAALASGDTISFSITYEAA